MRLQVRFRSFYRCWIAENISSCVISHSVVSDYKNKYVGKFWYLNWPVILEWRSRYCNLTVTSQDTVILGWRQKILRSYWCLKSHEVKRSTIYERGISQPLFVYSKSTTEALEKHVEYTLFYMKRFFSTQPQCCLTSSWIELQMSLGCCLLHITIIILWHLIFAILCSCLRLVLFMSYLCDPFFLFSASFSLWLIS